MTGGTGPPAQGVVHSGTSGWDGTDHTVLSGGAGQNGSDRWEGEPRVQDTTSRHWALVLGGKIWGLGSQVAESEAKGQEAGPES